MWGPYAFIIFSLLFLVKCRSKIVAAKQNETLLECASDADITIGYINSVSNTSISIAECDKTIKACRFLKPSLHNKYHLTYTDHGGILHIPFQDENLSGTYSCYKTYSPSSFVRMGIIATSCVDSDKATDYTDIIGHVTAIERSIVYSFMGLLMLLLCIFVAVVYRKGKNLRDSMEMKMTSDNLLPDRLGKEEEDIHEHACGYTEEVETNISNMLQIRTELGAPGNVKGIALKEEMVKLLKDAEKKLESSKTATDTFLQQVKMTLKELKDANICLELCLHPTDDGNHFKIVVEIRQRIHVMIT